MAIVGYTKTKTSLIKENKLKKIISIIFFVIIISSFSLARDAARDLRRMVGYTIVLSDSISKVFEDEHNDNIIQLSGGTAFKVDMLLLPPLAFTDVIVFAKGPSKEIAEKYRGKLPDKMLTSYKMLIDNEVYDVSIQ